MANTLQELMSRDPQEYSKKDLDEVIEYFRSMRSQFNAGNMRAGTTKAPTAKQKETQSLKALLGDIDL